MKEDWGYWLNEPIFIDKGVTNIIKRKQALYSFCLDGLIPFIESYGYILDKSDMEFYHIILKVLYTYYKGKKVLAHRVDYPHEEEHYNEYIHRIDSDAWNHFWSRWSDIQDFERDAYGSHLIFILPELIWSWMDFSNSKPIQMLEKELIEQDEQDEMSKGKDDPYLQENSKRDYQDRHW